MREQSLTVAKYPLYSRIDRFALGSFYPLLTGVDLPLVTRQPVPARQCFMALVAHGAWRTVPGLLGPRLVMTPNMSVFFALVLCPGPAAVFFGTLTVGKGVVSEGY